MKEHGLKLLGWRKRRRGKGRRRRAQWVVAPTKSTAEGSAIIIAENLTRSMSAPPRCGLVGKKEGQADGFALQCGKNGDRGTSDKSRLLPGACPSVLEAHLADMMPRSDWIQRWPQPERGKMVQLQFCQSTPPFTVECSAVCNRDAG